MRSPDEQRLLDLLHLGPVDNDKAREMLKWDDAHFEIVKADLVAQKLIIIGPDRGGDHSPSAENQVAPRTPWEPSKPSPTKPANSGSD